MPTKLTSKTHLSISRPLYMFIDATNGYPQKGPVKQYISLDFQENKNFRRSRLCCCLWFLSVLNLITVNILNYLISACLHKAEIFKTKTNIMVKLVEL